MPKKRIWVALMLFSLAMINHIDGVTWSSAATPISGTTTSPVTAMRTGRTQQGVRMKTGFAGLGQMGRPIALNPLKSGASLSLTDRTPKWFAESEARVARASISDSKRQQVPIAGGF